MRQAHAWELDLPIPSMLSAVESNLRMPLSFLFLAVVPLFIAAFLSFLTSQPFPPFVTFSLVSLVCYSFANGSIILLVLLSQLVFYVAAVVHVFIKMRSVLCVCVCGRTCMWHVYVYIYKSCHLIRWMMINLFRVNTALSDSGFGTYIICGKVCNHRRIESNFCILWYLSTNCQNFFCMFEPWHGFARIEYSTNYPYDHPDFSLRFSFLVLLSPSRFELFLSLLPCKDMNSITCLGTLYGIFSFKFIHFIQFGPFHVMALADALDCLRYT